jgi:hypothetical protein
MVSPAPHSQPSREGLASGLRMASPLPTSLRPSRASRAMLWLVVALGAGAALAVIIGLLTYPSDRTPEGAYYRVMIAVNNGRARDFFAYIETPAQHASYTIGDFRKRARQRVLAAYPEPERSTLSKTYEAEANAPDGSDVFALYARRRGWVNRLRKDLSGVQKVEMQGERATVVTTRGTRYPFRRRENGIWGLTLFTAELAAEADRAARDFALIDKAAADYERAKKSEAKR